MADPALWRSVAPSIVAIVIGGAGTYFKPFIGPEIEFRSRIVLRRKELIERTAVRLAALLQRVRSIASTDDLLRGDGRESPDLVGDLVSEVYRVSLTLLHLETMRSLVHGVYLLLMLTVVAGIGALVIASLLPATRLVILYVGLGILALQICLFLTLFLKSRHLDTYEDLT